MEPLISIIIPTYNRAGTLGRTVNSILSQSWKNFEIIIVDDGSTDHTADVLNSYTDGRITIVKHPVNRGVTAAKNTGLNNIRGDWFTVVDSDDELLPDALLSVINIPMHVDQTITKVTCNGIDSTTNQFTGKGVDHDQYLSEKIITSALIGDFWGITKTELLGNDRLNENIPGIEDTLWFKIYARARMYYLHKGLLLVHTEGADRVSKRIKNIFSEAKLYKELLNESVYLQKNETYNPTYSTRKYMVAIVYLSCAGEKDGARLYRKKLAKLNRRLYWISSIIISTPPKLLRGLATQWLLLKN